jgi:hypothetical protein
MDLSLKTIIEFGDEMRQFSAETPKLIPRAAA